MTDTQRKPRVELTVEAVVQYVWDTGIVNVTDVATVFDVAKSTARRKLDGGWLRGDLIRDKYGEDGYRLHFEYYRYGANDE
jgi:hypothetical protein